MSTSPATVLAFDYGLAQIGVAVGNTALGTSQALPVLTAKDGIPSWELVQHLVQQWAPRLLLVGEPLNMDGSASDMTRRARKFANRLHGRFGLEVVLVDERLSSFEAKQQQRALGHRGDYKRKPIDSYAAELIFSTWWSEQNGE